MIQYLSERHPRQLEKILHALCARVPRLDRVDAQLLADGRLLLQFKDGPFERPILAKFASDGTLKMLAYLTVLYDPSPPQLIGIEEPENHLYPGLLHDLAEECRDAAERSHVLVTTHSPYFVNALRPEEVWVLSRDDQGYAKARRVSDMPGLREFYEEKGQLGYLWMERYFDVGDSFSRPGQPQSAQPFPPPVGARE